MGLAGVGLDGEGQVVLPGDTAGQGVEVPPCTVAVRVVDQMQRSTQLVDSEEAENSPYL